MIERAFAGKRVLITGHTGFKGSWLAAWLHMLGAETSGYALAPADDEGLFESLGLARKIRHREGDVRDLDRLRNCLEEARPEFIFHLAAQSLVGRSYAQPRETFETNVLGSVNLLEAIRLSGRETVLIFVTSDKCYRDQEWTWGYRETDALGGRDPYSASKACAELVLSAYRQSYFEGGGVRCASVRAGNVIGGGDWAEDRIVPDCMRALRAKRSIAVRNPRAVRPWQHVLDPIYGYLTLAAALANGEVRSGESWNFGPPMESHRCVGELVQHVVARWGSGTAETGVAADASRRETHALFLNCDKARFELGWSARWNFRRAVDSTVDWYRCSMSGVDAWNLTAGQIRAYSETAGD